MKGLIALGILLMALGGALMIWNEIPYKEKHETKLLGAKISVTEQKQRRIPRALSGTVLGVGAALVVIGALRKKPA
jgi:hypothetical protein